MYRDHLKFDVSYTTNGMHGFKNDTWSFSIRNAWRFDVSLLSLVVRKLSLPVNVNARSLTRCTLRVGEMFVRTLRQIIVVTELRERYNGRSSRDPSSQRSWTRLEAVFWLFVDWRKVNVLLRYHNYFFHWSCAKLSFRCEYFSKDECHRLIVNRKSWTTASSKEIRKKDGEKMFFLPMRKDYSSFQIRRRINSIMHSQRWRDTSCAKIRRVQYRRTTEGNHYISKYGGR